MYYLGLVYRLTQLKLTTTFINDITMQLSNKHTCTYIPWIGKTQHNKVYTHNTHTHTQCTRTYSHTDSPTHSNWNVHKPLSNPMSCVASPTPQSEVQALLSCLCLAAHHTPRIVSGEFKMCVGVCATLCICVIVGEGKGAVLKKKWKKERSVCWL